MALDDEVKKLRKEVKGIRKKLEDTTGDDGGACCGCCVGLALGYLLWHGPEDHASLRGPNNPQTEVAYFSQEKGAKGYLLKGINHYQQNISPKIREKLGKDRLCKYEPSCSHYGKEAVQKYGAGKGTLMTMGRLLRCNPFSKGGKDPVA